ncbi:hypothetical protein [Streptomyces sp. NPDC008240]
MRGFWARDPPLDPDEAARRRARSERDRHQAAHDREFADLVAPRDNPTA